MRRAGRRARDEDHRRRQQRHQLPAGEERQRVARAEHEHQQATNSAVSTPIARPRGRLQVAERTRARQRDSAEHAEEEPGEPSSPAGVNALVNGAPARSAPSAENPATATQAARACTASPPGTSGAGREQPPAASAATPATTSGAGSRLVELVQQRLLPASWRAMRPRPASRDRRRLVRPVEDARALAPRGDQADPTQRGQVLRRRAGVEPELGLKRADRALAVAQQLQDPHARRMTEDAEETAFTS